MINRRIANRISTLVRRLRQLEAYEMPTAYVDYQIEALYFALDLIRAHHPLDFAEGERLHAERAREHAAREPVVEAGG